MKLTDSLRLQTLVQLGSNYYGAPFVLLPYSLYLKMRTGENSPLVP
jgi:hypothetical protein